MCEAKDDSCDEQGLGNQKKCCRIGRGDMTGKKEALRRRPFETCSSRNTVEEQDGCRLR
jgi:hypothetical protein